MPKKSRESAEPELFKDHDGAYKVRWPDGTVVKVPEPSKPPPPPRMSQREMLGDKWPTDVHPVTGEPFVRCESVEMDRETLDYRCPPPERPTREIWEWDDDAETPTYVREMTDEEYEAALKKYEERCKEWNRTGGEIRLAGHETITGRFVTASGAWAEGVLVGENEWHWTEPPSVALGHVSRETSGGGR